jgi:hypothetical protein
MTNTLPVIGRAASTLHPNSGEAQRARLLEALMHGPVDTVRAYRKLDILHVPRRVLELRRAGHNIRTSYERRYTEQGKEHRVGVYSLVREDA